MALVLALGGCTELDLDRPFLCDSDEVCDEDCAADGPCVDLPIDEGGLVEDVPSEPPDGLTMRMVHSENTSTGKLEVGSYADTHAEDGVFEEIKATRSGELSHRWHFDTADVDGTGVVMLVARHNGSRKPHAFHILGAASPIVVSDAQDEFELAVAEVDITGASVVLEATSVGEEGSRRLQVDHLAIVVTP